MNKKIIIAIVVVVVIYIAYRIYKEKKYGELDSKLREQMRTGSASPDLDELASYIWNRPDLIQS